MDECQVLALLWREGFGNATHFGHPTQLNRRLQSGEIGVLRGQCLDRRIDNRERLVTEIAAWEQQRNASGARIKWMFTTDKARATMGRAYPDPAAATRDAQLKES